MCGRFVLFTTDESLLATQPFTHVHLPHGLPKPRYNIAPTQVVPVLRPADAPSVPQTDALQAEGSGQYLNAEMLLEPARWGLIPHWAKELKGPPLFNARAETVASKPSFRDAFKRHRCAIPMDGYYEWQVVDGKKQPQWIRTGEVIWVAGLYSFGLDQLSATMITTDAVAPLDEVHHRMPRFLQHDELAQWIFGTPQEAEELLHPAATKGFHFSPADAAVGNVHNDYPELIAGQDK